MNFDQFASTVAAELAVEPDNLTHLPLAEEFGRGRCPIDYARELIAAGA